MNYGGKVFQLKRDLLGSARAFSVEQPSVPEVNRGFTGHIMVALEHGLEDDEGDYEETGAVISGIYAYGRPQIARDVFFRGI